MAIRMMVSFDNDEAALKAKAEGRKIEIVRDYNGHEEGVHHAPTCAHKNRPGTDKALTPECVARDPENFSARYCHVMGPLYMETTHEGQVLDTGEMNGYHDSDFYAVVCDGASIFRVTYASTRGWTYPNSASVDATDEIKEAAAKIVAEQRFKALKAANLESAKRVEKGKTVRVTKGKHKGQVGEVFWIKEQRSRYGTWSRGYRLGITLDGVKSARGGYENVLWVNDASVEVVDFEQYLKSDEDLLASANHNTTNWRGHTATPGMLVL